MTIKQVTKYRAEFTPDDEGFVAVMDEEGHQLLSIYKFLGKVVVCTLRKTYDFDFETLNLIETFDCEDPEEKRKNAEYAAKHSGAPVISSKD